MIVSSYFLSTLVIVLTLKSKNKTVKDFDIVILMNAFGDILYNTTHLLTNVVGIL